MAPPDNVARMPVCPLHIWIGSLALGAGLTLGLSPLPFLPASLTTTLFEIPKFYLRIHGGALAGAVLLITGSYFNFSAKNQYKKASTPVYPGQPINKLVTGGAFRLTRNPMYLSSILLQVGLAAVTNSGWLLLTVLPFIGYVASVAIPVEESVLEKIFGEEYRAYRRNVPRWLLF